MADMAPPKQAKLGTAENKAVRKYLHALKQTCRARIRLLNPASSVSPLANHTKTKHSDEQIKPPAKSRWFTMHDKSTPLTSSNEIEVKNSDERLARFNAEANNVSSAVRIDQPNLSSGAYGQVYAILSDLSSDEKTGGSIPWNAREALFKGWTNARHSFAKSRQAAAVTLMFPAFIAIDKYVQHYMPDPDTLAGKVVYSLVALGTVLGIAGTAFYALKSFVTRHKAFKHAQGMMGQVIADSEQIKEKPAA